MQRESGINVAADRRMVKRRVRKAACFGHLQLAFPIPRCKSSDSVTQIDGHVLREEENR